MDQQRLIFDDLLEALAEVVRALGGAKAVGSKMRPELPLDQAANWVRNCLNTQHRQDFSPGQIVFLLKLGREAGCHTAKHYLDDETGYNRSTPRNPTDALAELQREFIDSVKRQEHIVERIEHLTKTPLQAVK
jgi:hypothetical protein